jgi:hypothetical protein
MKYFEVTTPKNDHFIPLSATKPETAPIVQHTY